MAKRGPKPKPLIERVFVRCSVSESGCVEWTGSANNGYGQVFSGARGEPHVYVHRAVWEHFRGTIPVGLEIDHLCRNRACCRLDHLELVTRKVNLRRRSGWTFDGDVWTCGRGHTVSGDNAAEWRSGTKCRRCISDRRSGGARGREVGA